jgi:hypothetical protein
MTDNEREREILLPRSSSRPADGEEPAKSFVQTDNLTN